MDNRLIVLFGVYLVKLESETMKRENMITEHEHEYWEHCVDGTEKVEMFSIEKSDDPDELAIVNSRIDYQHRGNDLVHLCLYDYISLMYKRKRSANEMDEKVNQKDNKKKVTCQLASSASNCNVLTDEYWASEEHQIFIR